MSLEHSRSECQLADFQTLSDNIDYDDLKRAIKEYTTSSESKSISIPGKNSKSKAPQEFEDAMYARMVQEDDRVDQFVRSKHGELSRRLGTFVLKDSRSHSAGLSYPPGPHGGFDSPARVPKIV